MCVCLYQVTINHVEESEVNFVELVHSLLEDPSERKYFFQVKHLAETNQTHSSFQEDFSNSDNTLSLITISEFTICLTLRVDGVQHQKSKWGSTFVSQQQKREAEVGSLKLSCWRLGVGEGVAWSDVSWFLLRHTDGRVTIWHQKCVNCTGCW